MDTWVFEISRQTAGIADQYPDRDAPIKELASQLLADETGRTKNQDLWACTVDCAESSPMLFALLASVRSHALALVIAWPISTQVRTTSRPSWGDRRGSIDPPGLA